MKRLVFIRLLASLALGATFLMVSSAIAQVARHSVAPQPDANEMWGELCQLTPPALSWPLTVQQLKDREIARRVFREAGLRFFFDYPRDPRRWEWLVKTMRHEPDYWNNVDEGAAAEIRRPASTDIDTISRDTWDNTYRTILRPAFLASEEPTNEQRAEWLKLDLRIRYFEDMGRHRSGLPIDTDGFARTLIAYTKVPGADLRSFREEFGYLRGYFARAKTEPERQEDIAKELESSPSVEVQRLAQGVKNVAALYHTPFNAQFTTIRHGTIDLHNYRGKVVLIDFWATHCGACLSSMPEIKRVYEKYRDQGFEVIGLCMAENDASIRKVEPTLEKHGITWPVSVQSSKDGSWFRHFGLTFVGMHLLVNQSGLIVSTGIAGSDTKATLERDVRRLLGLPTVDNVSDN